MKRTARIKAEESNGMRFYRAVVSQGGKVLYASVKYRAQNAYDFCVRHGAQEIEMDVQQSPGRA